MTSRTKQFILARRLSRAPILALVALSCLHGGLPFTLVEGASRQEGTGLLFGEFPLLSDIYDARTAEALLVPGVPLPPPQPDDSTPRLGIVDSGVVAAHPQLRTLIVTQRAFAGSDATDTLGHGTLVALQLLRGFQQTLEALPEGFRQSLGAHGPIYPAIVSARVTDDANQISVESVIAAVDWVVAEGAQFVNLSLGFRGAATSYGELCNAIARHIDVIFFAAAGGGRLGRWMGVFRARPRVVADGCRACRCGRCTLVRTGGLGRGSGFTWSERP